MTVRRATTFRYRWREGFPSRRIKAAVVGREFDKIARATGKPPTPESVFAAAATPHSPLRHFFIWDVEKAARTWNLHQARNLLGAVIRVEIVGGKEVAAYRARVHTTNGYEETRSALRSSDTGPALLARFLAEVRGACDRYEVYVEIAGAVNQLRETLDKIEKGAAS